MVRSWMMSRSSPAKAAIMVSKNTGKLSGSYSPTGEGK